MRKFLALAFAGALAIAVASFAFAADNNVQTIDAQLTPTKLDKKKFKPAKIVIDIQTSNNDEDTTLEQPPSAVRTVVDFPRNMKFDTGAVPNCKVSDSALDNTTTDQAIEKCGKDSVVSKAKGTSAEVTADLAPGVPGGTTAVPVVVTAFNGHKPDSIYLHARADAFNNTSILVGKLVKGPKGFGRSLDVTIPPLDAGAISDFLTTVKAGKYVQARCKSKTNKFQARTTYSNHASTTATDQSKCKQKKKHRKH